MANLTNTTPDIHGLIPNQNLFGHVITHYKRGRYKIIGFAWLGVTDEWGFIAVSEAMVCRPLSHLVGKVGDVPRFTMKPATEDLVNAMMKGFHGT